MKTYSAASTDVYSALARMQTEFHTEIHDVAIRALFFFDDEETSLQVLKHGGYGAAAVVSITPTKQRAAGMADAIIVVDRASWLAMTPAQRDALIDHELQHLDRVMTEPSEDDPKAHPAFDKLGRPLISMRRHDHQFGWFDDVARRHGTASSEIRQARDLIASTQQLYFDFAAPEPKPRLSLVVHEEPVALTDSQIIDRLFEEMYVDVRPPIWARLTDEVKGQARMYFHDCRSNSEMPPSLPDALDPYVVEGTLHAKGCG